MALQFLDEQTAEKLFEHTFIKWLEFGYKGCYSPRETERELVDTTAWAWNSKTARDLMAAVTSSEKKIFVVGMRADSSASIARKGRTRTCQSYSWISMGD